jgi:hypothetical protein
MANPHINKTPQRALEQSGNWNVSWKNLLGKMNMATLTHDITIPRQHEEAMKEK